MDDEEETKKGLIILGRDVSRMPCFRNSFLYGISGGIGVGLVYFLFTSRTRWACHCAVASFTVITTAYWVQCRYNYSKAKFEMLRLKNAMENRIYYEGTRLDKDYVEKKDA